MTESRVSEGARPGAPVGWLIIGKKEWRVHFDRETSATRPVPVSTTSKAGSPIECQPFLSRLGR